MGEDGFGCRLEWEWVGVVVGVLGQTLQNQSSVMSDAGGMVDTLRSRIFEVYRWWLHAPLSYIQSYLKWDTRSKIYVSKGNFPWFHDVFSCWVLSMLHHWMPKRMDPSEGSPLKKPKHPWGSVVSPRNLKRTIDQFAPQFAGYEQHDAQEMWRGGCGVRWKVYKRICLVRVGVRWPDPSNGSFNDNIIKKIVFSSLVDTSWFDMTISLVYIDIHGKKLEFPTKRLTPIPRSSWTSCWRACTMIWIEEVEVWPPKAPLTNPGTRESWRLKDGEFSGADA